MARYLPTAMADRRATSISWKVGEPPPSAAWLALRQRAAGSPGTFV